MAYTRTNWESGVTPLSAGNMNNIEDGIEELNSNSVLIDEQPFWNGCKLTVWRSGNIVTARFWGTESANQSAGAKNAYLTIPEGFRPYEDVTLLTVDQNRKWMLFQAMSNGNIGLYYLFDAITSPTNIYGTLTWAAYQ